MSVKHVKEYYDKVASDYVMMKKTLEELEKTAQISPNENLNQNIINIKQAVDKLKENYMRISYIVFLLNMPNKKEKRKNYENYEKKKLNKIPEEHRLDAILQEDKESIDTIKSLM